MFAQNTTHSETPPLDDVNRYSLGRLLAIAIPLRVLIVAIGMLSVHVAKPEQMDNGKGFGTGIPWLAFDGNYYRSIAVDGYPMVEVGYRVTGYFDGTPEPFTITMRGHDEAEVRKLANEKLLKIEKIEVVQTPPTIIAFFPLYPGLGHLLSYAIGTVAGLAVVSNVCAVIGLSFFYRWVRDLFDSKRAFWATLFVTAWPGAVFFSAVLTEGLFFMLVSMVLYFATRRQLYTAAIICGISALSRPTAVAVVATLGLWSIYVTAGMPLAKRFGKLVLIGALAASGGVAYEGFIWYRYQDPVAYKNAQKHWEDLTAIDRLHERAVAFRAAHPDQFPAVVAATLPTTVTSTGPARGTTAWYIQKAIQPPGWNWGLAGIIALFIAAGLLVPLGVPRIFMVLPLIILLMGAVPNHFLRVGSSHRYTMGAPPLFLYMTVALARLMPRGEALLKASIVAAYCVQMYYAWEFSRGHWVG